PPERAGRSGAVTVLHLGQLSVGKGVPDLIGATARARAAGADLRLVLAGGWGSARDEGAIRAALARAGLAGAVELPGVVGGAAKAELLRRADLFALPTRYRYEGQPLAVLEAMAAALPVVATPRAAIPDAVAHEETGLLVPEGDG